MIPRAKSLIEDLHDQQFKILLPAPMLSEILSPVPATQQSAIMSLIDNRFQIAPFDNLAAYKCAELIHLCLTQQELIEYRSQHKVPKNKLKFDCMIAAIAITRRAKCIYSDDSDIIKFACGQIRVVPLPNLGKQVELF